MESAAQAEMRTRQTNLLDERKGNLPEEERIEGEKFAVDETPFSNINVVSLRT